MEWEGVVMLGRCFIFCIALFSFAFFMGLTNFRFHTKPKEKQIRVACVGDSITYGTTIPNTFYQCYPAQLGRMLGKHYHVANFGFHGKTAVDKNKNSYRRTKQYLQSLTYLPDIVVLMFGTNDTKAKNWISQEQYEKEYKMLIQNYQKLASRPQVIVCTPSSAYDIKKGKEGHYQYGINEAGLQMVCSAVKKIAKEMKLECIDMFQITAGYAQYYRLDGIHPDKHGAKIMAEAVYKKLSVKINA